MRSPPATTASDSAAGAQTRTSTTLLRNQPERAQRRQGERRRERLIVPGNRLGLDAAEVAHAAAAVGLGIGVQDLTPTAADRHPDAVLVARHRREVEDADERRRVGPLAEAGEGERVVRGVVRLEPAEPGRVEVEL